MDYDCELTNEIKCPHCGHEFSDSWEYESGEEDLGLLYCDCCGKEFYTTRNIEITYSTYKPTYGRCLNCGRESAIESYDSSIGSYRDLCLDCGGDERRRLRRLVVEDVELRLKGRLNQ